MAHTQGCKLAQAIGSAADRMEAAFLQDDLEAVHREEHQLTATMQELSDLLDKES